MPHVTAHERLYAREFILTWQRDSRYGRADVIPDSKNGFEQDENSDYAVAEHGDTVLASVVNARKRKNVAEPGRFRVTAVWLRRDRAWRMAMLQPSRIVG